MVHILDMHCNWSLFLCGLIKCLKAIAGRSRKTGNWLRQRRNINNMTNELTSLTKQILSQEETIDKLMKEKAELIKKWFTKGQQSVKRKNKSGCCCIINDSDEIESLCGAHEAYIEEQMNF